MLKITFVKYLFVVLWLNLNNFEFNIRVIIEKI